MQVYRKKKLSVCLKFENVIELLTSWLSWVICVFGERSEKKMSVCLKVENVIEMCKENGP